MPFAPTDITDGRTVPGTTRIAYQVSRDGEWLGVVSDAAAIGRINSGQDPREKIAARLSDVEESVGFEQLAAALRITLDLG